MAKILFGKPESEWISQYAKGHTHPVNRACHTFGIPMIVIALVLLIPAFWIKSIWPAVIGLFITGWLLQFIGHAFQRTWPEFFYNWRYLFVGLRWWVAKIQGKA